MNEASILFGAGACFAVFAMLVMGYFDRAFRGERLESKDEPKPLRGRSICPSCTRIYCGDARIEFCLFDGTALERLVSEADIHIPVDKG